MTSETNSTPLALSIKGLLAPTLGAYANYLQTAAEVSHSGPSETYELFWIGFELFMATASKHAQAIGIESRIATHVAPGHAELGCPYDVVAEVMYPSLHAKQAGINFLNSG